MHTEYLARISNPMITLGHGTLKTAVGRYEIAKTSSILYAVFRRNPSIN